MKKDFFKSGINVLVLVLFFAIILIVLVVATLSSKKDESKFTLDSIYNVYPEEIRELYTNMVSVSCSGDLHLNLKIDETATSVQNLDNSNLIDYMFSHLDKNNKLTDNMQLSVIVSTSDELFSNYIDLGSKLNNYHYGDYVYNLNGDIITRKKSECIDTGIKYISQLYGYSYNEHVLSLDVNMGYLQDGYLYDFADKRLGEYDGDLKKLGSLFVTNSYYRYNFILDNKIYKLDSVEWLNKS